MFVGHYSASFVAKAADTRIPLWLLFLAAQLVDIFWAIFLLLGLEKVRIVPGITAANPLDLYFMPYTHSLVAALLWAIAFSFTSKLFPGLQNLKAALLIALTVFSHWLLDLLVHRPDLPLVNDQFKLGFGLWNYPLLAFALEAIFLLGSIALYYRATSAVNRSGRYSMAAFGGLMLAINAGNLLLPPPKTIRELAVSALASYFAFAAIAFWLERKRTGKNS